MLWLRIGLLYPEEEWGLPGLGFHQDSAFCPPLAASCARAFCLRSPPSCSAFQPSGCWLTCLMSCWKPGPG